MKKQGQQYLATPNRARPVNPVQHQQSRNPETTRNQQTRNFEQTNNQSRSNDHTRTVNNSNSNNSNSTIQPSNSKNYDSKTLENCRTSVAYENNCLPPASPKQTIASSNPNLTAQDEDFLSDDSLVQKMMDRDDSIIRKQHQGMNPFGQTNQQIQNFQNQPQFSQNQQEFEQNFENNQQFQPARPSESNPSDPFYSEDGYSYNETLDSFANHQAFDSEAVSECRDAILDQQAKMDEIENHLHRRCNDQANISLGMTADEDTITDQYQDNSFQVMEDTPMCLNVDGEEVPVTRPVIPNPVNQKSDRSMMNAKFGEDFEDSELVFQQEIEQVEVQILDRTEQNQLNSRYSKFL